jgi:hypothetical protein
MSAFHSLLSYSARTYSKALGEPAPRPVRISFVAAVTNPSRTADGAAPGFLPRYSAAPPAVWGEAILVPDIDTQFVLSLLVERMSTPGA